MNDDLLTLLNTGVEEAISGSKSRARALFQQALKLDRTNETALLWLAWTTDDVYEAVELLEQVIARNPANQEARAYLLQARTRKDELDKMVADSNTLGVWSRLQPKKFSKPKLAVPVIGEYLLRQGYITQQQLDLALKRHRELAQRGSPKLVGQVLVELGYITQHQLESGLQQQRGEFDYRFQN